MSTPLIVNKLNEAFQDTESCILYTTYCYDEFDDVYTMAAIANRQLSVLIAKELGGNRFEVTRKYVIPNIRGIVKALFLHELSYYVVTMQHHRLETYRIPYDVEVQGYAVTKMPIPSYKEHSGWEAIGPIPS